VFDEALKDGTSIATLTRGALAKERLPYPANGLHSIRLAKQERLAMQKCLGDLTPGGFVRRALFKAAGLPEGVYKHPHSPRRVPERIAFALSREERAAIDAILLERDLTAWMIDAVRVAIGKKSTTYTDCADATIRKGFRRLDLNVLLRALPGRTSQTIYFRALKLGCETELTDDRMTLRQACIWSGYTDDALRRRMEVAGFKPMALTGSEREVKRGRVTVYRRVDVSAMMKARYESIAEAARRRNCDQTRLKREMIAAGHPQKEGERYWLLPAATFDAVIDAWRARLA
jgi:hypothetical protein